MPKLHPYTSWCFRSIYDRIFLINHSWDHYAPCLRADKSGFVTTEINNNLYMHFEDDSKNIKEILEKNVQTNFYPLIEKKVNFLRFSSSIPLDSTPQPEPDTIANFKNSDYVDQRIHGLDQKSLVSGLGRNIIYSTITPTFYNAKINRCHVKLLITHVIIKIMITAMFNACKQLQESCPDTKDHVVTWATNYTIFQVIIFLQ